MSSLPTLISRDSPRFLRKLLESCPRAGNGVHPWLFSAAYYLHRFHTEDEIDKILRERTTNCGRDLEPHEIPDAIRNSRPGWKGGYHHHPGGSFASGVEAFPQRRKRAPKFDADLAKKIAGRVPFEITPEWLAARSSKPVDCSPHEFLSTIFTLGEKTRIFGDLRSQGRLWPDDTDSDLSRFRWPAGMWFLSNPVDGRVHSNPRVKRQSRRSMEAVTAWRYAVLECDQEPKEVWLPIWLKILVQLPLPIVSITSSAGKSVHALVRVDCASKETWDDFKHQKLHQIVRFGADNGALSSVRLTRLPNAYRGNRLQRLLYLDPEAQSGVPILAGAVFYL